MHVRICFMAGLTAGASLALLASAPGAAGAQEISLTIGADYSSDGSSDDLPDADGSVWLYPISARLYGEQGSIGLSLAYVDISGESDAIVIGRRRIELTPGAGDASGFTDIVLSAERSFATTADGPLFNLSGSVKLPTASEEDGLGSGAADFGLRGEISHAIGGVYPYAYLGGRLRGDSDTLDLRDTVEAGFGVQWPVGEDASILLGYDYRTASLEGGDDAHDLSATAYYSVTDTTSLAAYLYGGLTEASPEIGVGVSITRRFGR